jgi:hypothetical protein
MCLGSGKFAFYKSKKIFIKFRYFIKIKFSTMFTIFKHILIHFGWITWVLFVLLKKELYLIKKLHFLKMLFLILKIWY